MDKRLREGATRLGVTLSDGSIAALWQLGGELLKWNQKVNLTAITEPDEVAEKHLLDSVAICREVGAAPTLLDMGAGAGFPGIPLAIALPQLHTVEVDSVAKKIGFVKHAAAVLALAPRVRGVHQRLSGEPEREGLSLAAVVVARALIDVDGFVALAKHYALPGGKLIAMLGRPPDESALLAVAQAQGVRLINLRAYTLPFSGDPRAVAVFEKP